MRAFAWLLSLFVDPKRPRVRYHRVTTPTGDEWFAVEYTTMVGTAGTISGGKHHDASR